MSSVVMRSREELREQRADLLRRANMSFEELDEAAQEFVLNADQRAIWETVRTIDFLLGDDD
ncbi:MAG TPA: hypothetical protein VFM54_05190 [Micromonosporaceae bacterium]|nr:hypothetical protein [Micromonosporaceae bacterium]